MKTIIDQLILVAFFIRTLHWWSKVIETRDDGEKHPAELRECAWCHRQGWFQET